MHRSVVLTLAPQETAGLKLLSAQEAWAEELGMSAGRLTLSWGRSTHTGGGCHSKDCRGVCDETGARPTSPFYLLNIFHL